MFFERLDNLCKLHGTTPTALSSEVGYARGSVTKWKSGTVPSSDVVLKIARYFDVSTDYLLGLTDEPDAKKAPLADEEGRRIIHIALKDSGLLGDDGELSEQGGEVISNFIRQNADMLKQLMKEDK